MTIEGQAERVVALAGGVGGAKLAQGLAGIDGINLEIVVNTADDFDLWGLHISPDLDTVMYTLAGLANPATGWGIAGDTHATLDAIARYGENPWFSLGDRDFATHILRTQRLHEGVSLTTITNQLARALGIEASLLPMTNQPVASVIRSGEEMLEFQEYFVGRRQEDRVDEVILRGIERAQPAPGVIEAIEGASVIVFCPSNPIVSIGPILAVPGIREAISTSTAPRVAISPLIGGKALKGPADRMLASLGHRVDSVGVAAIYQGLIDVLMIDETDRDLAPEIEALGIKAVATGTVMGDRDDRIRLAREVLDAVS